MNKPEIFNKVAGRDGAARREDSTRKEVSASKEAKVAALTVGNGSYGKQYEMNVKLPETILGAVAETAAELESLRKSQLVKLSRPVLTIARFQAREEMEGTLLRWINRILSSQSGFRFAFNNYGSMPGKPLYWRVQEAEPFRRLTDSLRVLEGWLQGNGCHGLELFSHPRLHLVDELDSSIEREVLLAFSASTFYEVVELQEVELLATEQWANDYRLVSRFSLLPEGFKQADNNH
ncbi:hypothetical protein GCM10027036_39280 [Flavihumibacter cheonanensis]|uniref:hypothetical protein n=1 Tax=Flavihumibacter cheonanensis TaxID=1442385 RepID=UPI001EF80536|nr:hypothetical protein [Flavihumibacter cheonanensis]MCG7753931.1 hypothetical protein [Flavihumibacter cheonanensis]